MFEPYRLIVVLFYLGITVLVLRQMKLRAYIDAVSGAARAILQLLVMGAILMAVFKVNSRLLDALILFGMVTAASVTAARRSKGMAELAIVFVAIFTASTVVIVPMATLGVFDRVSSFLIPLSGMVIGNAMNTTALSIERLHREMEMNKFEIEALLSLGIDIEHTTEMVLKNSISAALIPILNSMKTTGLVHIPGLMTGMLLSGADPFFAAEMQAIIIYLIFIGTVLSSLIATRLQRRTYFTSYEALKF